MARKRKKEGVCCICGKNGPLSPEHVPPQAAFNKSTVILYSWDDRLTNRKVKGKKIQGGAHEFTLCEKCNNDTGSWYGGEYVKWAKIGHDIVPHWKKSGIEHGSVVLHGVYPLRFLKQVVTCFFSVATGPGTNALAQSYPDLAKFVLDKEFQGLPSGFRFYLNLYWYSQPSTNLRRFGIAGRIPVKWNTTTGEIAAQGAYAFSEIAHPPFQLLMFQDGEDYPDATEITYFKDFEYDEEVADLPLQFRIGKSSSPYPGANY